MKIAVIGAGAIGGLIYGYLKLKGVDIVLVGRKKSKGKINLKITGVRGDFLVDLKLLDKLNSNYDLIIFATKMQDLETALLNNKDYLKKGFILLTQNGIGAEDIVSKYIEKERIISSIVLFGATYIKENEIIHNFEGKWLLGSPYNNITKDLEEIKNVLSKGFEVELVSDILSRKWLKVFLNANNCLPALVNKTIQETFSNLEVCEIAIGIWHEGLKVIEKANIQLKDLDNFTVEKLKKILSLPLKEASKAFSLIMVNLSKEPLYGSILQSIKRNRPSEIDYINGAFVKLGRSINFLTPLNKRLVELVHKVEETKEFLTITELIEKTKKFMPQYAFIESKINSPFPKLKLTVIKVEGDCYHGYKKGDEIILEDFTHPPKYFCLGLAHVLFPIIYALSFGAKFPFSENQRSLEVTCPDGGKLSFKVEIFDKEGEVEVIPKDPNYKGSKPKDLIIEVVKSSGNCFYGYKVGDRIKLKGLRCPEGFCGAAFHTIFPALFALNFGAKFFFMDNPSSIDTVTCPDGGKVVFKVIREE